MSNRKVPVVTVSRETAEYALVALSVALEGPDAPHPVTRQAYREAIRDIEDALAQAAT